MDPIARIKTIVFERLTSDATLQGLFPDSVVSVANVWPEPDEPMPYIVYRAMATPAELGDIASTCRLIIDIWDSDATGERFANIKQRVSQLLSRIDVTAAEGVFRFRKSFEQELEEDTRYVWRITSDYSVRFTRQAEMSLEG